MQRTSTTTSPELPTDGDAALARESIRRLAPLLRGEANVRVSAASPEAGEGVEPVTVDLPPQAARLLMQLLSELARGNAVAVLPVHTELTTQQAADMLGMSRAYFVRLLDAGELAFTRTGTHRRIRLADLMEFKERREAARLASIDHMVVRAQEQGVDY